MAKVEDLNDPTYSSRAYRAAFECERCGLDKTWCSCPEKPLPGEDPGAEAEAKRFYELCNELAPGILGTPPGLLVPWRTHNDRSKKLLFEVFKRLRAER